MAFKLNKGEETRFEDLKLKLSEAHGELEAAISAYNTAVAEQQNSVEEALSNYNGKLAELKSFVDDFAGEKRSEWDDKSEGWQEGDAGSTANDWISAWEETDLEEVTLDFPSELSKDFENHGDVDLSTEP